MEVVMTLGRQKKVAYMSSTRWIDKIGQEMYLLAHGFVRNAVKHGVNIPYVMEEMSLSWKISFLYLCLRHPVGHFKALSLLYHL